MNLNEEMMEEMKEMEGIEGMEGEKARLFKIKLCQDNWAEGRPIDGRRGNFRRKLPYQVRCFRGSCREKIKIEIITHPRNHAVTKALFFGIFCICCILQNPTHAIIFKATIQITAITTIIIIYYYSKILYHHD